ncbi:MAG TPA: alpha-hydroxy acid oxidase [Gammaproteobacteria bacterium]|nr:alpha-hydroxy acid oxidase [Gammaproteobacteria bacterium]
MVSLDEFEKYAKSILSQMIFDYFSGGACDEISVKKNREAFDNIDLIPRVLTGNNNPDQSTKILGQLISTPILIAPTSFHGMATPEGEIATIKAAKTVNTIMIASTMANTTLEEIASVQPNTSWFQLYLLNDKGATCDLINRAENAGYKSIVLTVDSQTLGIRYKDVLNQFKLPDHLEAKNLTSNIRLDKKKYSANINCHANGLFDKTISWKDVEWLQTKTKLPIILKGILHKEDAKIAAASNIAGIIVSNHGGRQLDTAISPIAALPEIIEAINTNLTVFIDGGIRRGTDIIKAIALGADAILIGRPIIWGLIQNSTEGAIQVLRILQNELHVAMVLCGFSTITDIKMRGKDMLRLKKNDDYK